MYSSVVEKHLSDGSIVYNVVFVDGSAKATIAALDSVSAKIITRILQDHAAYATISS